MRCYLVFALAALASAGGCAANPPTCRVPTAVELEIETSDRVNQAEQHTSLPVDIRLYQLKNASEIEPAVFDDIWNHASKTLEATLLTQESLTVFPGQIVVVHTERDPKADYLAGFAVFRSPAGQSWRTLQEWPLPGDPCAEQDDSDAAPTLERLRIRMFLRDYRIESVNNYTALAKRRCRAGDASCAGAGAGGAPDELRGPRTRRRLRTFEEDPSPPRPTTEASP